MKLHALLPIAAVAMLAWPASARPAPTVLHVALCGGGSMDIPVGGGDPQRPHRDDGGCVMACHAVLGQRKRSG